MSHSKNKINNSTQHAAQINTTQHKLRLGQLIRKFNSHTAQLKFRLGQLTRNLTHRAQIETNSEPTQRMRDNTKLKRDSCKITIYIKY